MKRYKQLSLNERKDLYVMQQKGLSKTDIAKKMGRHRTTIKREIRRNTNDLRTGYLPDGAHELAIKRKARHGSKIERNICLKDRIIERLRQGDSPEIIAGRLIYESSPLRISKETIYKYIYSQDGQKNSLYQYLLKGKPKRGPRKGRAVRAYVIPDRISIHDRAPNIASKKEFGHLEGDLTFFTGNQSMSLGVAVEKKTRFTILTYNTSKQTSEVIKNLFNSLAKIPKIARKSITFDNGGEFIRHTLLKHHIGMDTFFCDKRSPWQKGQVEQMNCMIHRYLPKKSDITKFSAFLVQEVQDLLNNKPRKCLGFKTPTEAFQEQLILCGALQT